MKKTFIFLYVCFLVAAFVLTGGQAFGAEFRKRTTRDIGALRPPSDSGKTTAQPQIVAQVYDKPGLTKRECANIVDKFFEVMKETLTKDGDVMISGFGKFRKK